MLWENRSENDNHCGIELILFLYRRRNHLSEAAPLPLFSIDGRATWPGELQYLAQISQKETAYITADKIQPSSAEKNIFNNGGTI